MLASTPIVQRCFIALELGPDDKQHLMRSVEPIKRASRADKPRWLEAASLHVTLKFLGSAASEQVAALTPVLANALAERPSFQSPWAGFGGLPRRAKAHVLVAVLRDDEGHAMRLWEAVDEASAQLGFAEESRDFKPHATVARFRTSVDVRPYLSLAQLPRASVELTSVALYQSTLAPGGARYTALARFPLKDR
jgi:RNA 2',3'-cyclic 3'-phosphodiesterase